jgi:hypothetical protein
MKRHNYFGHKKKRSNLMSILTAMIHKEEDMYIAECSEMGTISQGSTIEEAVANQVANGALPGGVPP